MNITAVRFRLFIRALFVVLPILMLVANANAQTSVDDPAYWAFIGGYEADTHGTGYTFFGPSYIHPVKPGLAWTARVFGNYLYYGFDNGAGETKLRSPGIAPSLGLRLGAKNTFTVSAGPEVKWRRTKVLGSDGTLIQDETKRRFGGNFGAETYMNPTSHNNVQGLLNYNTSDKYTWGRLGFKEQVSNLKYQGLNTAFVGVEGIAQGNKDIRSVQAGGFIEVSHLHVSVMFKAGYKRSMFDVGPDKTGPYFAIGYYQRLN